MTKWHWHRWTIVIVGRESGNRTTLPFVRFRNRDQADIWCIAMNLTTRAVSEVDQPLTYFTPEEIKR